MKIKFGKNTDGIKDKKDLLFIMGKRITIVFDEDLLKKLRFLQAKQIKESAGSVSFSKVINEILQKAMKK